MDDLKRYFKAHESDVDTAVDGEVMREILLGVLLHKGPKVMLQIYLNSIAAVDKLINMEKSGVDNFDLPLFVRTDDGIAEFLPPGLSLSDNILLMLASVTSDDETIVFYVVGFSFKELGLKVGTEPGFEGIFVIDEDYAHDQKDKIIAERVALIEGLTGNSIIKDHLNNIYSRYKSGELSFDQSVKLTDNIVTRLSSE